MGNQGDVSGTLALKVQHDAKDQDEVHWKNGLWFCLILDWQQLALKISMIRAQIHQTFSQNKMQRNVFIHFHVFKCYIKSCL